MATDALQRCSVPPVVQEDVFSFDDEMMGREMACESGTLNLTVEPDTPSAVMNGWNNERKAVRLIRIDFDKMCLCKIGKGMGKHDFRACTLGYPGRIPASEDDIVYQKSVHSYVQGAASRLV